ncbi:NUMOD4 motif-containing HNH endonuclease [Actinoplanes oblitus]|uniref:NUMOD4 motif-containing HNH endonuclease n=1 Tax=Actinoplanes oblitus TaxID=3040509 RepID=A0ABY8WRG9_9ACTN|nr:NUMOD4 motif-containing HNH endonuclease [Actinoplanes oblitus]WIM99402.1 NUMOD4 motif-containing HNH endonuclease [Actinoplanes oblitus]
MEEIWLPLFGQTWYEVSNLGRVRSWIINARSQERLEEPVILNTWLSSHGYPCVSAGPRGKTRAQQVHTLVLTAFAGPRPDGPGRWECRHIDGDKTNNRWPENLKWGTAKENGEDRARLHEISRGEERHNSVLTAEVVVQMRERYALGGVTYQELAIQYGLHSDTIGQIIRGTRWKHFGGPRTSLGKGHGRGGNRGKNPVPSTEPDKTYAFDKDGQGYFINKHGRLV